MPKKKPGERQQGARKAEERSAAKPPIEAKSAAMPQAEPMTARRLRQLAEEAVGRGKEKLVLVYLNETGGKRRKGWFLIPEEETGGEFRVPVNKDEEPGIKPVPPAWGRLEKVIIKRRKKKDPEELDARYDALFWSQTAIEKFVLDYYRPLKDPAEWQLLYDRVMFNRAPDDKTVLAIAHTYPSIDESITDDSIQFLEEDGEWVRGTAFMENLRKRDAEKKARAGAQADVKSPKE